MGVIMADFDFLASVDDNKNIKQAQTKFIGTGEVGGKAHSLKIAEEIVTELNSAGKYPALTVDIPEFTVLRTGVFDDFMQMNGLYKIALSDADDSRIAHEFQKADLPFEVLKDLRDLISKANKPLAIRSSSLLEDSKFEPFAGIYNTKMLPNNQMDIDTRCRKLYEAVKLVYASTFFKAPKDYMKATKNRIEDEKMAVIIQEVIGRKHDDRFYPDISGVARSYNFYPMGRSKPEEGVVDLAVGLGKTIVDGGMAWTYSPEDPAQSPPYGSINEIMKNTQNEFWHIRMSEPDEYDPINETEFMLQSNITEAEKDFALSFSASTVSDSGRITPGIGSDGPRIVNFAPILKLELLPLNDAIKELLKLSAAKFNTPVEIEFAVTTEGEGYEASGRLGFLQVRPIVHGLEYSDVKITEKEKKSAFIVSESSLGNGSIEGIKDIVYIRPEDFNPANTEKIAAMLESINDGFLKRNEHYILMGPGRWGSSDPWLGIPVKWAQISQAKVIIEHGLKNFHIDPSQGSHFFQNITLLKVMYFTINPYLDHGDINMKFLNSQKSITENKLLRHIKLDKPVKIKVNGITGEGIISIQKE